jgi:hypothetical protein
LSADNYIFIDRNKNPIEVWHCVASAVSDDLQDQKCSLIGKAKTFEEAFDLGEKEYTEYGITTELWSK